jgi:hypothetical protein
VYGLRQCAVAGSLLLRTMLLQKMVVLLQFESGLVSWRSSAARATHDRVKSHGSCWSIFEAERRKQSYRSS